jgi:hypothetical protein
MENTGKLEKPSDARSRLTGSILRRKASLTEWEAAFLHGLLVDPPGEQDEVNSHDKRLERAARVLDDDILFSAPALEEETNGEKAAIAASRVAKPQLRLDLWKAHADGVHPKLLVKKGELLKNNEKLNASALKQRDLKKTNNSFSQIFQKNDDKPDIDASSTAAQKDDTEKSESAANDKETSSVRSDEEVRHDKDNSVYGSAKADDSSGSSWPEEDGGFEHYDAWEVLKDEYAEDFGFDYTNKGTNNDTPDDERQHVFKILGTSADDVRAMPHVLSPPMMDSLLSFVPETLSSQNYWLKFSLVRDGASLSTLKQYARAAENTILAIETTTGAVFGSFTSSPWRTNLGFYGSGPAFLWKMRHSRQAPCHSLFEQAQMESEIDVFFYCCNNGLVQVCSNDKIAVGGGDILQTPLETMDGDDDSVNMDEGGDSFGFGLCINRELQSGTSGPCASFRNPCLSKNSARGEVFNIVNLEVWTYTPCDTVAAAERLEMTKFFVEETIHDSIYSSSGSIRSDGPAFGPGQQSRSSRQFSSKDLVQSDFYRRVGDNDQSQEIRDRWQDVNLMQSSHQKPGGIGGHTPRYS